MAETKQGRITIINGPVIKGTAMGSFHMRELVLVGKQRLIGEIIALVGEDATIQVYEESAGLKAGEEIIATGKPLSVQLGPGIIGNMFDGIERPLRRINDLAPGFLPTGIGLLALDQKAKWPVQLTAKKGEQLVPGQIYGQVQETASVIHRLMVPPAVSGVVETVAEDGLYDLTETLIGLKTAGGALQELTALQDWPVRTPRPVKRRLLPSQPLITGQRVLDTFFPLAKGGTAAIPGGFGTGKTMTQHQLAKWSDADIIIYVGCGERGNEMTEVLEDFPQLVDPRTGRSLMERTVLIANTSNMPVAAREASIYTGITLAEYYRDMGYQVAVMADSTSRWAEALRELSGRLEEMPAEEGYPAYLPSRLAQFYERSGAVETLADRQGSVTIIGAVSPAGGDFSEPVTQNTKRFVGAFWGLDRELAYGRHFPAVNWLSSYSGYLDQLAGWYEQEVGADFHSIRARILQLLHQENELQEIVKLVGADVLPDDQRLVLAVAQLVRAGFLNQNAFHAQDTAVPLKKQYLMLKTIDLLYQEALAAVKAGIPISQVRDEQLFGQVLRMKDTITNDDFQPFADLERRIDAHFENLAGEYTPETREGSR